MNVIRLFLLRNRHSFVIVRRSNMGVIDSSVLWLKNFQRPLFALVAVFRLEARVGVHIDFRPVPFLNVPSDLVKTGNERFRRGDLNFPETYIFRIPSKMSRFRRIW